MKKLERTLKSMVTPMDLAHTMLVLHCLVYFSRKRTISPFYCQPSSFCLLSSLATFITTTEALLILMTTVFTSITEEFLVITLMRTFLQSNFLVWSLEPWSCKN